MRILVTGASGATAAQLVPILLAEPGRQVFCADVADRNTTNWFRCDLAEPDQVDRLLDQVRPDQIYHLAGTFTNEYATDYRCNVVATKNLLDACAALKLACRTLLIGSAAEYGCVSPTENPVVESHPLAPVSVYGLTKVFQTHLMKFYVAVRGLDLVMARTFNLMGSGLSDRLFVGRVEDQIRRYKSGEISTITVGNLESARDYIDVAKAAVHYHSIMNRGRTGEIYNVGSGKPLPIRELLVQLLFAHGLSSEVITTQPPGHPNKLDIQEIYASIAKLRLL